MSQLLIKSQDIRYTKLTFVVQFTEDTMLPKQKVSAIRGGIEVPDDYVAIGADAE